MTITARWGIIGTGIIAARFAEGLADAPGAELTAVASRSRSRAETFAATFGARKAHESYEALAADAEVDIVYVATPNFDHRASALMMLEAKKAVVCEKPFALDAAEASEVISAARRHRVFCMEAMWMRFIPAVRELVDRVRDGALGEVRGATIELGHRTRFDAEHRLFAPRGGGALLDLGVYTVSLAQWLFGAPNRVQSQASFAANGVDEHVTALLAHDGARQSAIGASLRTQMSNDAVVFGTQALAHLHEPLYRPHRLTIARTPALAQTRPSNHGFAGGLRQSAILRALYRAARSAVPASLRGNRSISRPYKGNGYQYEAIEAMRCLHEGQTESPLMKLDDTLRVMETLDAIRANWKNA